MPKAKDLTAPLDLLSLASLDSLPEVAEAIAAKEVHASALARCEEALLTTRREMAFYSASGQSDPGTASTLAQAARERLQTLEASHHQLIGATKLANKVIDDCREATRLALLPELRRMAVPVIERRLEALAVLAMVARLLGAKAPARTMRESHAQEKRYLEELRAVLTTADPS